MDSHKLVAELAAFEAVFNKPLAIKGGFLQFNIPFLPSILDKVLFSVAKRHRIYTMQSFLEARLKYFGELKPWFGALPPEYHKLKELDPFEQIAEQVYYVNDAIKTGLGQIDDARYLRVDYEQFCRAPEQVPNQIMERFAQQGCPVDWHYPGPKQF